MAVTNYQTWLMHLHVGKKKVPLTVYPTDQKDTVTVMYGKQKWEAIDKSEAEAIVGCAVLTAHGQVSM
jgi:hypothetical protein